ncbi:MAG: tetratricopeptide repeat protein [Verrucomicrobiae bacterium]|nr:tetratricopeptide repeat protein [Verrucomicrobiae bacterium]
MAEDPPQEALVAKRDDLFDDANGDLAIGDLESAVDKYRRCVEIDPAFFDGWHALGMALMKTGQIKEAIGAGLQATTLKPNDLLAWTSLSQMFVQDGQIGAAEDAKANARILSLGGRVVKEDAED